MSPLPAPPDQQDTQGPQAPAQYNPTTNVPDVTPTTKERVWGGIRGVLNAGTTSELAGTRGITGDTPMDKELARQHQVRLDEARMHRQNMATYGGALATGIDPQTGKPLDDDTRAKYQNWFKTASDAYAKSAGIDKNTKSAIQRSMTIMHHVINMGRQSRGEPPIGGDPSQQSQRGIPPPPGAGAAGAGPEQMGAGAASAGGAPVTPPAPQSGQSGQSAPSSQQPQEIPDYAAMGGGALAQQADDTRDFNNFKRKQELLRDIKVDEERALATAKAQTGNAPRPVFSRPIGVLDARSLAQQGKVFTGDDGQPIDLTELPDTMALTPFVTRVDGKWETRYIPVSPSQQTVTIGNETYAVSPYDKTKMPTGQAGTDIGVHNVPTTTRTTDPATGQTTVATHTPTTTGAKGAGATRATPATPPQTPAATPRKSGTGAGAGASTSALPALDENGHIPETIPRQTPQIVEGANQLLDGTDKDKLPTKTRELSANLARQYGWEQGKFTPKEQVMLRESTTFLQRAMQDPSLAALDEGFMSRQQLAQVLSNPDEHGMVGRAITSAAAQNMSPQQAAFVRMYNQLVGTISGLGQLVRSGRATDSTIDRLRNELPNPLTTKDSADARKRITRLLDEIDVAMKKGTFEGTGAPSSSKRGLPAPPSASTSIDDEIMKAAAAAGKPH